MANLSEIPAFPGVTRLETADLVLGGADGAANLGPGQLTQRTSFLVHAVGMHALTQWKSYAPLLNQNPPTTVITDNLIDAVVVPAADSPTGHDLIVAVSTDGNAVRGPHTHALEAGPLWTVHDVDPADSRTPISIAYHNDRLVIVGAGALIAYSDNFGASWTIAHASDTQNYARVLYNAELELWVAVGQTGEVTTSSDGATWSEDVLAVAALHDLAMNPITGRLVAVGANADNDAGVAVWSDDGVAWNIVEIGVATAFTVGYGDGWWIVGGQGGDLRFAADDEVAPFATPTSVGAMGMLAPLRIVWVPSLRVWVAASYVEPHHVLVISGSRVRRVEVAPSGLVLKAVTSGARGQLVAVGDDCAIYESACVASASRVYTDPLTGFVSVEVIPWV